MLAADIPGSGPRGGILVLLVHLVVLGGCAERVAVLEIELDLPAAAPGETYYVLPQARAGSFSWDDAWPAPDLPAVRLAAGGRTKDRFSIVTSETDVDLLLKIHFCPTEACPDDSNTERRFRLEHPFYPRATTSWSGRIDSIPAASDTEPTVIDRCAIAGCLAGETSSYCRSDGTHLCEWVYSPEGL